MASTGHLTSKLLYQSDWYNEVSILHGLTVGSAVIVVLYVVLRLLSSRSLAPNDQISWISAVALGSTVSRTLTTSSIDLVRSLIALAVPLFIDYFVTFFMCRSKKFAMAVKGPPVLCVFRGAVLHKTCKSNRVERSALLQALRSHGLASFEQADCIVMESTGSFSVVPRLSVTANPSGENLLEEGVPAYAKALDAWKEGMMVLDM